MNEPQDGCLRSCLLTSLVERLKLHAVETTGCCLQIDSRDEVNTLLPEAMGTFEALMVVQA